MAGRDMPLNPMQVGVLAWVRDGCPDGVYGDWSHRIVARALHNRGLVVVQGRGPNWKASLTEDGTYYLSHETNRPSEDPRPISLATKEPEPASPKQARTSHAHQAKNPAAERRNARSPSQLGLVDQLMNALETDPKHWTLVPWEEGPRYRQLVGVAKRFGRIPEGMQLSFDRVRESERTMLQITLEPVPAWQTEALDPVPVRTRLQDPSDVAESLVDSPTFQVAGEPRRRALRLLDALVNEARERDMTVTARTGQFIRHNSGATDGPRRDEIMFTINSDEFRLWFTQSTLQRPHEPTARELARARRGYLFPDYDEVPEEHLGVVLDGAGGTFWASSWKDTDEHGLEDDLAQILEEIRLRHESLVDQRATDERRQQERQRQWDLARESAVLRYREHFVIEAMLSQAKHWENSMELRRYATAVRRTAAQLDEHSRPQAIEWAEQIDDHADTINPLPASALPPQIPEPSPSDLKPFMGSWSPYGP